uniref:Fibronectin type III domain protein n=1 Tax=Pectobacterium carotovorum TaxID=554 RepID=A0A0K0MPX4_PECCA|nr:Fibronectin type III domain protein [Pectobacterium carotovorum]
MYSKFNLIAGAGGGGKKGGSSRTPIEAVDNVESKSLAFILDLLGEGVIGGLKEGGKSVFLDDVPLLNPDGTPNFSGVKIWERQGQQNQDPIDGFDDIETPKAVAVEIKQSMPKTIQIDNDDADRVRVIMDFPRLTSTNKDNGDISGATVEFQFQLAVGDGPFQPVIPVDHKSEIVTVSKKSGGKFQREYFIDLPKPGKNYRIKVIRLTGDSNTDYLVNKTILSSYGEIIFAKMSYPNSALVGICIDSKEFGNNLPRRSYLVSGLLIRVPSNYDPIDNKYDGDWDGTFEYRVSSNPAWILYDLLISSGYGLGRYVKEHMIDVGMLYQIGRYCDDEVDDGFGGKEKRFSINTVITTRQEAFKVINDIASVFRGMVFWAGGVINMRQDSPSDPVMLFSSANIIGRVARKGSARKDRPTVAVVTYNDKTDLYKQNIEYVEDQEAIKERGIHKAEVLAFGCTSRGQAYRTGLWLLYTAKMETDVILYKAGIDCSMLMPGDVVKLNDKYRSGKRNSGRIVSFTKNSIKLDQSVNLSNAGAFISFMSKEGKLIDRNVLEAAGERNVLTFKEPLKIKEEPQSMAVWMVTEPDLEPELVRIISIKDSEEKGSFEITGVSHNPSKYQAIDNGAVLVPMKTTVNDPTYSKPSGLEIIETTYLSSPGNLSNKLVVSWQGRSTQYTVRYRRSDVVDNWTAIEVLDSQYEIVNVSQGSKYDVEVFAVSIMGRKTETIALTYTVLGKSNPPNAPKDLIVLGDYRQIVLKWVAPTNIDLEKIIVYGSKTNKFEAASLLASVPSTTFTHAGLEDNQTWFYWVRAVNKRGMLSSVNSNIGTSATTKEVMSFLKDKITSTELSKDLLSEISDTASNDAADKVMNDVNESIKEANDLAQEAKKQAEQISSDLTKTVNEKIGAESQKRSEAILAESKKRTEEIRTETTARELAINTEVSNRNTAILNEKKERGVAISESEKKLQDANQLLANRVNTLSAANEANTAAIKKEEQARTTAVSSEASKRESLAAQMRGDYTGTDLTKITTGLIFAEREARVGGDKSEAVERKSMETRFNNSLSTVNKSIESATTAQKAQSGEITAIKNTLNNKADSSALTSINTKVEQNKAQITSLGEQTTQLKNNVNTLTTNVNQKADSKALTALQNEVVQHKGLLSSQSSSLTNLENTLQDLRNDSSNLLKNGLFSDKLNYWKLTGSNVKAVVDEGENAIRFDVAKTTELLNQSVYLKVGKTYRISVWVKLSNDFSVPNWGNTKIRLGKISGEHLGDTSFAAALNKNAWTHIVLERAAQFTGLHDIAIITNQTKGFALIKNVSVIDAANDMAVEANAKAIESVKSDVTKQAGLISSNSNKVTSLENSLKTTNTNVGMKADATALSSLDSKVTQQGKDIASHSGSITALNNSTSNIKNDLTDVNLLARITTNGKQLIPNPNFMNGEHDVSAYNNANNGNVLLGVIKRQSDNPTSSSHELQLTTKGAGSPYYGGFVRGLRSKANAVFVTKYIIKLPVGWNLEAHANPLGDGSFDKFVGSSIGTGKYETYYRITKCGATGSFQNGGHVSVRIVDSSKAKVPTATEPLVWHLAQIEVYETTDYASATPEVTNFMSSAKSSLDSLANTTKSQSTQITNLQNSLNITNGNVNKKADATAVTNLDSKVAQQGKDISSQSSQITNLQNGLNTANGNVNKKADASALTTLNSKVTAVEGKVNSATSNITSLSSKIDQVKADLTDLVEVDLDLSKLDVNKYYPVTLHLNTSRRYYFKIFRTLSQYPSNNPSYATHGTKTFSVILEWNVSGSGWGTQPENRMIQNFSYRFTNQSPVLNVSQMTNSSIEVVYLRGGSFYQLTKYKNCSHSIRTEKYTTNSQSVEPIVYNASLEPVTAGTATSNAINDLSTKVTSVEGKLDTTSNQVTSLNTAIGKKAESSAVTALQSTVTQHGKDISATNSNVSTLTTKVNANVTKIEQVSKTVNDVNKAQTETKASMESQFKGQSTKIENLAKTVASSSGLSSTWMVKMEANAKGQKYAAGIALGIEGKNLQSQFLVQADRFALINTANGTTTTPFVIDGGVTYISAASIKNGSIDSAKFGDIQSNNYKANATGWKLSKSGTLEMNGQTSGKGRLSITNNRIDVYDEKGVLRVRLGLL